MSPMGAVGAQGGGHLGEQIKAFEAIRAQALTTSGDGQEIDRIRFNVAVFVMTIGAATGTPTVDIKLQHTATSGSGYVDATAGQFGAVAFAQKVVGSANTIDTLVVDMRGMNQFVRLNIVVAGGSPNMTLGVVGILSGKVDEYPAG